MILLPLAWSFFLFLSIEARWLTAKEVTWPKVGSHEFTMDQDRKGVNTDGLIDFKVLDMRQGLVDGKKSEAIAESVSMLETRDQTPKESSFKHGIRNVLQKLSTFPPKLSFGSRSMNKSIQKAATQVIPGIPPPGDRRWYMGGGTRGPPPGDRRWYTGGDTQEKGIPPACHGRSCMRSNTQKTGTPSNGERRSYSESRTQGPPPGDRRLYMGGGTQETEISPPDDRRLDKGGFTQGAEIPPPGDRRWYKGGGGRGPPPGDRRLYMDGFTQGAEIPSPGDRRLDMGGGTQGAEIPPPGDRRWYKGGGTQGPPPGDRRLYMDGYTQETYPTPRKT